MTAPTEFQAMIADYRIAVAEFNAADDADPDRHRYLALAEQILAARPTSPADMGLQLKWIVKEGLLSGDCEPTLLGDRRPARGEGGEW